MRPHYFPTFSLHFSQTRGQKRVRRAARERKTERIRKTELGAGRCHSFKNFFFVCVDTKVKGGLGVGGPENEISASREGAEHAMTAFMLVGVQRRGGRGQAPGHEAAATVHGGVGHVHAVHLAQLRPGALAGFENALGHPIQVFQGGLTGKQRGRLGGGAERRWRRWRRKRGGVTEAVISGRDAHAKFSRLDGRREVRRRPGASRGSKKKRVVTRIRPWSLQIISGQ